MFVINYLSASLIADENDHFTRGVSYQYRLTDWFWLIDDVKEVYLNIQFLNQNYNYAK